MNKRVKMSFSHQDKPPFRHAQLQSSASLRVLACEGVLQGLSVSPLDRRIIEFMLRCHPSTVSDWSFRPLLRELGE